VSCQGTAITVLLHVKMLRYSSKEGFWRKCTWTNVTDYFTTLKMFLTEHDRQISDDVCLDIMDHLRDKLY
jgi:hypothetical protein